MTSVPAPVFDFTGLTVAFDLDGTLVDTSADLAAALNVVLIEDGLPALQTELARVHVGQGAAVLLEHGFAAAGVALDDTRKAQLVARFIAVYRDRIAELSRPYAGVEDCLQALRAAGARCVVCTNKLTDLSDALLRALGLDGYFTAVVGQDRVAARKPDGGHVIAAITLGGGDPRRAVMIGDSEADLLAARHAGVPSVLFLPGYGADAARALGPDAVFGHYDELPGVIAQLLS